jgi:hypothetical protein
MAATLVVACQSGQETPQVVEVTPTLAVSATALDSPLPTPTATLSAADSPLPTPTRGPSSKGRAAVRGILFLSSPEFTAPEEDGIYLIEVDTEDGPMMVLPVIDPETSLRAEVDEVTGAFFFDDVEPGLYALAALTTRGVQLSIRRMDTGEPQMLTIDEADVDTVIDIGQMILP